MRSHILQSCICASVPLIHSVLNSEGVSARPEALFFETSLVCHTSDTTREIPKGHRAMGFLIVLRVPCSFSKVSVR